MPAGRTFFTMLSLSFATCGIGVTSSQEAVTFWHVFCNHLLRNGYRILPHLGVEGGEGSLLGGIEGSEGGLELGVELGLPPKRAKNIFRKKIRCADRSSIWIPDHMREVMTLTN